MDENLKDHIEYLLCIKILEVWPISGGDISQAFLLVTDSERFFCKINTATNGLEMFQVEKAGLEAIAKTETIATPKVILCEKLEVGAILVMEYIESKRGASKDMALFGHQLAALHQFSGLESFGLKNDNFIGSLHQSNKRHASWPKFYVQERLLPQLKLAFDAQLFSSNEVPSEERLNKTCKNLFQGARPSLLHGDLWSGNYLISDKGCPYLIDPAIYYGHNEVDLAMTKLFGGFDSRFYNAYGEHFPKVEGEKERNDIYQLYYLLVHLNLFGSSYKSACTNILKTYF